MRATVAEMATPARPMATARVGFASAPAVAQPMLGWEETLVVVPAREAEQLRPVVQMAPPEEQP
jgi:hypothetical protein